MRAQNYTAGNEKMRKLLQMEERIGKEEWPTEEIRRVTQDLYEYLSGYKPEGQSSFSKSSIMGPVGKLLAMVSSEAHGKSIEAYVGAISNVHYQQTQWLPTTDGQTKIKEAVEGLLKMKEDLSPRLFRRILQSVDYGVYYLKTKQITERIREKKESRDAAKANGDSAFVPAEVN